MDFLAEKYPIKTYAHFGDTMKDMMARPQYIMDLQTKKLKVFMWSGGGNDILGNGNFAVMLNQYNVEYPNPQDALYYITQAFYDALVDVTYWYDNLAKQVAYYSPKTLLLIHGYDYPIPQQGGWWLGNAMEYRGLHPYWMADLCQAILHQMIDAFNSRLKAVTSSHTKHVRYINLRNRVNKWYDELHPYESAAAHLATEYERYL